ncbi:hypothetical protein H0G86_002421 [Trichoderma simmonsii]|uniref:Uncharacterized protein n=1 Tax=Trichoderma simmonsii TaxID=1491479 RepID=A0A8G0L3G5_9HYPO|nr:hypothetical protein H0G86_002421 [Trichoderma simmonsii]
MTPTFILTSAPLLLSQVPLASFVPDISQPYADGKRPYTVSQSEYSVQPDADFKSIVAKSSEKLLEILATKFSNLLVRREEGSTFRVEAEGGNIYTLNSPDDLFTDILASDLHGEQVKRFLEQWKQRKLAPRFVVGYRTFVDAKLDRANHASGNLSGTITVPISATQGDLSGILDVKTSAARKTKREIQSQATIPGERIYAIAYRKIKITTRKGVVAAALDLKTMWESFSGARGGDDEDDEDYEDGEGDEDGEVYLEAGMSSDDDDEDCEIFVINSALGSNGQAVRIGLLEDES